LLPFWPTLIVGALNLAAAIGIYGFALQDISVGGRTVAVTSVALALAISLIVCRIRLDRETRLRQVMIARERLTLLSAASSRVGSTLDVTRTAQELAEAAVPRFADFVAVDLFDSVLAGEEPKTGPLVGPVTLRRVAQESTWEATAEAELELGAEDTYPEPSLTARSLSTGRSVLAQSLEDTDVPSWLTLPRRAGQVRDYGLHSEIAVPLRARGVTLGVALFIRHQRPEPFDDDDLLLADEIGARAAVCVDNARRYTHEHDTSLTLQRSLLPRRLPELAAVEVASRYLPADASAGVGGDWFDVIPLSGARVALVVGDVVGHGLHASATMGRLRAAVGTLADSDLPPDELLTHLDDVVIRLRTEDESGQNDEIATTAGEGALGEIGATCLYAVYDPVSRRCTLARAGHPPPVLVMPDGSAGVIDLPAGPPLGLGGLPFESSELELPEGSLLALYTDGLIESRHRDVDQGLEALVHALTGPAHCLEAICDAVLKALFHGHPADDVALLIARTRALDTRHVATWDLAADPTVVAEARDLTTRQLTAWGMEEAAFTTELVVSELVTNAIRYAGAPIQLRLIHDRALICEVSDGSSTSPHLRRARTSDEGGRGLFIIANLTEHWGTRPTPGGKTIWAEQAVEPAAPSSGLACGAQKHDSSSGFEVLRRGEPGVPVSEQGLCRVWDHVS
jgi:serine phosphatase RsbU (regulator of sigma subunit)/anti-sigma regulatory factor (Ser/Thr protein kinase)